MPTLADHVDTRSALAKRIDGLAEAYYKDDLQDGRAPDAVR
jgi:hypothetical protein